MADVEHLIAMSDNAGELIDEMVRWKYEVAQIVWPYRKRLYVRWVYGDDSDDDEVEIAETYGQWFERIFYESIEDYRKRAEKEKIGEKVGANESQEDNG